MIMRIAKNINAFVETMHTFAHDITSESVFFSIIRHGPIKAIVEFSVFLYKDCFFITHVENT